jgi:hypothetical protein
VTGEEARNPRQSGLVLPLNKSFNTIEDAEKFLCLPIPRPRTSELRLHDRVWPPVSALRSHDLETLLDPANGGKGGRMATIRYLPSQGAGAEIEFRVCARSCGKTTGMETTQPVTIQGSDGKLATGTGPNIPSGVEVTWEKGGYGFSAFTHRLDDYRLEEFLAILETVS